jgi:CTP synthase
VSRTKFIIVTGGVLSGLGKGTATAAISRLLRNGKRIVTVKCDGYLNVDPGTMNPVEHGEVFVLEDGGEVDMDFGHYERFLGVACKFDWNLTSGKVFMRLIERERRGDFLGKTIQIFPHVINEIQQWWFELAEREKADIMTIEIGGTIGDWENSWFTEAARQLKRRVGDDVTYIHLTYVPFLDSVGEPKSKPAQRDIAQLRELGIIPDVIIARSKMPLSPKFKEKLATFCDVNPEQIISGHDIDSIYEIPLIFDSEGIMKIIGPRLGITQNPDLVQWRKLVERIKAPKHTVTIAIGGKYTELRDSYASIIEALNHSGANVDSRVMLRWVESTDVEQGRRSVEEALKGVDALLVPGGFGSRGTEGKMALIQYARERGLPYLGICYGLQLAVIEFCRNVCGLADANSTEIDPDTKNPVVDYLPDQRIIDRKGGTMRLGAFEAVLKEGSMIAGLYGGTRAIERHRHRYEVNPVYHEILLKNGLGLVGMSPNGKLVEFIELPGHPYFVATQAHNELTSRLEHPNPLFLGFVTAALKRHLNNPVQLSTVEANI